MYNNPSSAEYYHSLAQNAAAFRYNLSTNPAYYGYQFEYNPQISISSTPYWNQYVAPSTAPTSSTTPENEPFSNLTSEESKIRRKPKKMMNCGKPRENENNFTRIFIWELDDMTMFSNNIVAHSTNQFPFMTPTLSNLCILSDHIVRQCFQNKEEIQLSNLIHFEDAEYDENTISIHPDSLQQELRKNWLKMSSFRQFYNEMSTNSKNSNSILNIDLLKHISYMKIEKLCESVEEFQNLIDQRWKLVQQSLDLVTKRSSEKPANYANVVISNDGLIQGAAKLLITRQSDSVPINNIYSTTAGAKKQAIFERIISRFNKKCTFITVTSSVETEQISKQLSIPVWKINDSNSIERLIQAQKDLLAV